MMLPGGPKVPDPLSAASLLGAQALNYLVDPPGNCPDSQFIYMADLLIKNGL